MADENYTNEVDSIYPIERIDFDVYGNDEILENSVLGKGNGIETPDLYEKSEPRRGGVIDPRLGTTSNEIICATCGLNTKYCPGHSGHITLAEYVFNVGYIHTVIKILSCVCVRCSKILLYKNEDEIKEIVRTKTPKERLAYVKNATKNVNNCQKANFGCGTPHPKIRIEVQKKTGAVNIVAEYEETESDVPDATKSTYTSGKGFAQAKPHETLTAEMVYEILKNISDNDCIILGLDPKRTRPEYMIHKIMLVPPVQMRPSVRGEFAGGMIMADDLTTKLVDIIKINLKIIKNKENQTESSSRFHSEYNHLLQYHIATYMENEALGMARAEQKGRPIKSVADRLKGKTGRFRSSLMGKRIDYCSRTVITSDPSVRHNQIRIPVMVAMDLTFPEVVTPQNIEFLRKLVKRGRDTYPGANSILSLNSYSPNKRISLKYRKEGTDLHYGDIVNRHLIDGDIVLLNRQPTLHKQSMMGFYIKVVNDPNLLTFGLSPSVTKPFNADFDGDLTL